MRRIKMDDPDLALEDLMREWPQTIPVFMRYKMLCVGCMVNPFHTVMDACAEYGLDLDEFNKELAEAVLMPSHRLKAPTDAVHIR